MSVAKCGTLGDLWKWVNRKVDFVVVHMDELHTEGDREIRFGSFEIGRKASGPNRQFGKGLGMWSGLIRVDQGEMGIRSVRQADDELG